MNDTKYTEEENKILDRFYSNDQSEFIISHVIRYHRDIKNVDLQEKIDQLKWLRNITVFFIVVFTLILIYIAAKGFFHV